MARNTVPLDFAEEATADIGTPSADTVRVFADAATGELSAKKSSGAVVSLESGGGAGAAATYVGVNKWA